MQENHQRQFWIKRLSAGGCVDLGSVDIQMHGLSLLGKTEGLAEIADDILSGFDADGQPDQLFADPGCLELFGGHLLMGRARRMNHKRFGIADIGHMAD